MNYLESATKRFYERFIPITETGCWIWEACLGNHGYGVIGYGGHQKTICAHRFSWMIHHGEIPEGMDVLHKCDVRACVNPSHLFLGTQRDNNKDKIKKSRQAKGRQLPISKLSEEAVREIRKSTETQAMLAIRYGVNQSEISRVKNWQAWRHVS